MRLLAWNLNHRGARRRIPAWIGETLIANAADVVVLTEYIEGPDHAPLCAQLSDGGLTHCAVSERVGRSNQVLVAAREPMELGDLNVPWISEHSAPNVLHVRLPSADLHVIGFRMPAWEIGEEKKRVTWEWLGAELEVRKHARVLIAGDFNTAPGDAVANCGDCIGELIDSDWTLAEPPQGCSFRPRGGFERRIDHAFLSPSLSLVSARYDWTFVSANAANTNAAGTPDHAMLVVDFAVSGERNQRHDRPALDLQ